MDYINEALNEFRRLAGLSDPRDSCSPVFESADSDQGPVTLFHLSNWGQLADAEPGQKLRMRPGPQGAEGKGVYFSAHHPVKASTAEGTHRTGDKGPKAVLEIEATSAKGWWRTKPAIARKFKRPVTWHTDGKDLDLHVTHVGVHPELGIPHIKAMVCWGDIYSRESRSIY